MAPPKTEAEKQKLIQEFRAKALNYIREGYWTSDNYICKWLEDKNFRVDPAEKAFRKMLKWRIDNKIEGILNENMEDLYKNIVYYLDGVDNKGRPVLCIPCNDCSVRDKLDEGEKPRLERVFCQILEKMVQLTKSNSMESDGKISTFVAIVDVQDVDVQFVTPKVISFILEISKLVEEKYPGMMEFTYIINASKAIKNLYTMIRPGLRAATTSRLKIFSNKRHKWEKAILDNISENQLRCRFGGTLDDSLANRKTL